MENRIWLVLVIALGLVVVIFQTSPLTAAITQMSFTFDTDTDTPLFLFEENLFNDTATTQQYDYNQTGNVTYWINIPKTANITNATMNVTGRIIYIYNTQVIASGIQGISIGNISGNGDNEIMVGTQGNDGRARALYGVNGTEIWDSLIQANNEVYSTSIGEVNSSSTGNEILVGSEDTYVYLLNRDGTKLWSNMTGGEVKSVLIDDIHGIGVNKMIVGADDVYVYNDDLTYNWTASISQTINAIAVGNLTSDSGNETVVGCNSGYVYIINSSGNITSTFILGTSAINSVDIGNVTDSPENEIVVGSANNNISVINASGEYIWNYTTGGAINDVKIGNSTAEYAGNEVIAGSDDQRVYTLDKYGNLIWSFEAASYVNTIEIGNVTSDPGNEVLAGAGDGYLYVFNFDYFPTNVSMDVGTLDANYDWNLEGKLRNTTSADGFADEIQTFLDSCTADADGSCNVSFVFHSFSYGGLNMSAVNITYDYNLSSITQYQYVDRWSRTVGVEPNESVGNRTKEVYFTDNPSNDVTVSYLRINQTATHCDFNGSSGSVTTVGGNVVCDMTDFIIQDSGATPSFYIWDSNMSTGVPVYIHELPPYYTIGSDNNYWKKNMTIVNTSATTMYNVTANASVDDLNAKDNVSLRVYWSGSWCNITPTSFSNCNVSSPVYQPFSCSSDTFFACANDSNGNNITDLFKWIQPYANSSVDYQITGISNLITNMTLMNVTPTNRTWGQYLNFSVLVNDTENDTVEIKLWVYKNLTEVWSMVMEQNISQNGTYAWFNVTLDNTFTGLSKFKFEHRDWNVTSNELLHAFVNTSNTTGPEVLKHSVSIEHEFGNETYVNRSGSQNGLLSVRILDLENTSYVGSGINCTFRVTTNGSTYYDAGTSNLTNDTGYCNIYFDPDGNYTAENQTWYTGTYTDPYYFDNTTGNASMNLVLGVKGDLSVVFTAPESNGSLLRSGSNYMETKLVDEYGSDVVISGMSCVFWFDGTEIGNDTTNASGNCNYTWSPACSVSLGNFNITANITGSDQFYNLDGYETNRSVMMKDTLFVNITVDVENASYAKGESFWLNSTSNDSCADSYDGNYSVTWSSKWKRRALLEVVENNSLNITNYVVTLNGTELESLNIDLNEWEVNKTMIVYNGLPLTIDVKTWTNDSKTEVNDSLTYLNNFSEIVFAANLASGQNHQFYVYYNYTWSSDDNITFIRNGGFESNSTGSWSCEQTCLGLDNCLCESADEGSEAYGNYSAYITGKGVSSNQAVGLRQNFSDTLGTDYIKVVFKTDDDFDSGAYIRIYGGSGMCEFNSSNIVKDTWYSGLCYHSDFSSANFLNVTLHSTGQRPMDVFIDYMCLADSSGACLSYDAGKRYPRNMTSEDSVGSQENVSWTVPSGQDVGKIKLIVNASGDNYVSDVNSTYVYIYGWSNVSNISFSSRQCTYNQTNDSYECMMSANISILCTVSDVNTSKPIRDYNVSFYHNETYIGFNITNSEGLATFVWLNSTNISYWNNVTCNISDQESVYYNATANNSRLMYFNVTSGITYADVYLSPLYQNSENLTKAVNDSFILAINISNTGLLSMYDTEVNISVPGGFFNTSVLVPPLSSGEVYNITSTINVTYNASTGNQTINVTVAWKNADTTPASATNASYVNVTNSTVINIKELYLNYSMPVSVERNVGNFTVENYGNTQLINITFKEEGDNASSINAWIEYEPQNVSSLNTNGEQEILVNITLPSDATQGMYMANITANASNSTCHGSSCWDVIMFNLTVEPYDWERTPSSLSKTVGLSAPNGTLGIVTITNNKDVNYTFNVSIVGNGTGNISVDKTTDFVVENSSIGYLYVYHNTSYTLSEDNYYVNITIHNQNNTVPEDLNVSVNLDVIRMNLQLLSPNATNPVYNINASDTVSISTNLTFNDNPLDQNVTWYVTIGGNDCTSLQSGYNSSSYLWVLNCSAPTIADYTINNTINVSVYYVTYDYFMSDPASNAVNYQDITPPEYASYVLSDTDSDGFINVSDSVANIYATVNVTDNYAVDDVWCNITFPNGTSYFYDMAYSGGFWILNTPNPNDIGDYKIDLYANDTIGNTNSTTSLQTGFFDVYDNIRFQLDTKDKNNNPFPSNITLYKPGTNWTMHEVGSNSTGYHNHSLHRRVYDFKIEVMNQSVTLYGANFTSSAVTQHGNASIPENLTDPLRFDYFDNRDVGDIGNLNLPTTADNVVMVFVVEAPNLTYSSGNLTLNYSNALAYGGPYQENKFEVLVCTSWDFSTRVCSSTFTYLGLSSNPDVVNNLFTFVASPSTAYAIAEYTEDTGNGDNGNGDNYYYSSGGGSSSTPRTVSKVCGNSVCESGENEINCPGDCLPYPFTIQTGLTDVKIQPGENKTYSITITNLLTKTLDVNVSIESLGDYITLNKSDLNLTKKASEMITAEVNISKNVSTGLYTGYLVVSGGNKTNRLPINMRVGISGESIVKLQIDLITKTVTPDGELKFIVDVENVGFLESFTSTIEYNIKSTTTEHIYKTLEENISVTDRVSLTKSIPLNDTYTPDGEYFLEVWALVDEYFVKDIETFNIATAFWNTIYGQGIIFSLLGAVLVAAGIYGRKQYIIWRASRMRYVFPTDFGKLPQKTDSSFWVGRVAETDKDAYYNPLDLKTHILTAGATGSGKSVSASVIVEEALDKNIAVLVFDPTAQWTGFVKPCTDDNLLRYYDKFKMKKRDAHSYRGKILEVTDPQEILFRLKKDLPKYMTPGEITVFTLDKLQPGQYDEAVNNIISVFFQLALEESTELRMIMVFDEVHRLLEKYGGKGGYIALEKACREFRKWGIGLIMCSQVLSDFKEAIAGNVLTDIQLNTKSITDIQKVQSKYGQIYAERISRQGVGVGMVQHPKYNDGKPYFVNFRPTYHNPHKIPNEDMDIYRDFMNRLDFIEITIGNLKKQGQDTSDMELEFKLTNNKLKQGEFRLAKIYINSLEERLGLGKGGKSGGKSK